MYGIGFPELLIILVLGLLCFGSAKLPAIGQGLGRAVKEFKAISRELSGNKPLSVREDSKAKAEKVSK